MSWNIRLDEIDRKIDWLNRRIECIKRGTGNTPDPITLSALNGIYIDTENNIKLGQNPIIENTNLNVLNEGTNRNLFTFTSNSQETQEVLVDGPPATATLDSDMQYQFNSKIAMTSLSDTTEFFGRANTINTRLGVVSPNLNILGDEDETTESGIIGEVTLEGGLQGSITNQLLVNSQESVIGTISGTNFIGLRSQPNSLQILTPNNIPNNTTQNGYVLGRLNGASQVGWVELPSVNETITSLIVNSNTLIYTKEDGTTDTIDLSLYLDDSNLSRITSGVLNDSTAIATFTRDDNTTFTLDLSSLLGGMMSPFQLIDEGNGNGIIKVSRNNSFHGNVGLGAVDLSESLNAGSTRGATGTASFAVNQNSIASGTSSSAFGGAEASGALSFAIGGNRAIAAGLGAFAHGQDSEANGSNSIAMGNNTVVNGAYGFGAGFNNNVNGTNGVALGQANTAFSFGETVLGIRGTSYTASSLFSFSPTDRLLNVGNGDPVNGSSTSDAFTILKNGLITAPSLNTVLIDAEASGKVLITKEWFNANSSTGSSVSVSNGLNINSTTGDIEIGGQLDKSTVIDIQSQSFEISSSQTSVTSKLELTSSNVARLEGQSVQIVGTSNTQGSFINLGSNGMVLSPTNNIINSSQIGQVLTKIDATGRTEWRPVNLASVFERVNLSTGTGIRVGSLSNPPSVGIGAVDLSSSSTGTTGATGLFSLVGGNGSSASGDYATAFGLTNIASGRGSTALGTSSEATAFYSIAGGNNSTASSSNAVALGDNSIASGQSSVALNNYNFARGFGETSIGIAGTDYTPTNSGTDRLLNVGNGGNFASSRSDAFTVYRNGAVVFHPIALSSVTNAIAGMLISDSSDNNRLKFNDGTQWINLY